jgi:hypothetical protein
VQPEELPSLVAGIENFLLEFPGFVALQQKNQWNNVLFFLIKLISNLFLNFFHKDD